MRFSAAYASPTQWEILLPSRLTLLLAPPVIALLSACTPPDAPELRTLGSAEAARQPYPEIAPTAPLIAQANTRITPEDTASVQAAGAETARRAALLQARQLDQ